MPGTDVEVAGENTELVGEDTEMVDGNTCTDFGVQALTEDGEADAGFETEC